MPLPPGLIAGKRPLIFGGLAPVEAEEAPIGGSAATIAPGSDITAFIMEGQLQDQWCWSAVSVSVSRHYNPKSDWTQCSLANAVLNPPTEIDCCVSGDDPFCDVPYYLDKALSATSNLHDVRRGIVGFADLTRLVESKKPLAIRVAWSGGGGHFMVVHGWQKTNSEEEFVEIADPYHGASTVKYNDLIRRYRGTGSWTHSYWTKA